eukprot:TRINITY_DN33834_c0_g2_i1.p1 TRINITY_DN33834_c0_g2~~TRINITY_DN33834_c0_g2_i1.p1  ORF type:complete len:634 (-),score=116.81 TRINITY_DN33834_c0_g2_i1:35-1936(-)
MHGRRLGYNSVGTIVITLLGQPRCFSCFWPKCIRRSDCVTSCQRAVAEAVSQDDLPCDGVVCDTTHRSCACAPGDTMRAAKFCEAAPARTDASTIEACGTPAYAHNLELVIAVPPSPELTAQDVFVGSGSASLLTVLRRCVAAGLEATIDEVVSPSVQLNGEVRENLDFDGNATSAIVSAIVDMNFCDLRNRTFPRGLEQTFTKRFIVEAQKFATFAGGTVQVSRLFLARIATTTTTIPVRLPPGPAIKADSGSANKEAGWLRDSANLWPAFAAIGLVLVLAVLIFVIHLLWLRQRQGKGASLPDCLIQKLDSMYDWSTRSNTTVSMMRASDSSDCADLNKFNDGRSTAASKADLVEAGANVEAAENMSSVVKPRPRMQPSKATAKAAKAAKPSNVGRLDLNASASFVEGSTTPRDGGELMTSEMLPGVSPSECDTPRNAPSPVMMTPQGSARGEGAALYPEHVSRTATPEVLARSMTACSEISFGDEAFSPPSMLRKPPSFSDCLDVAPQPELPSDSDNLIGRSPSFSDNIMEELNMVEQPLRLAAKAVDDGCRKRSPSFSGQDIADEVSSVREPSKGSEKTVRSTPSFSEQPGPRSTVRSTPSFSEKMHGDSAEKDALTKLRSTPSFDEIC